MADLTLFFDKYQLNMAYAQFQQGTHTRPVVFEAFFRRSPFGDTSGSPCVFMGLARLMEHFAQLRFTESHLEFLSHQPEAYSLEFLEYLRHWQFDATMASVPEGTLVFPREPVLWLQGPILTTLLVETALLCITGYQTLVATKAARIYSAAVDPLPDLITKHQSPHHTKEPILMEFGARRAQETEAAIWCSRAAYIVGFHATSNVLAGQKFDIPCVGTHSHAWVQLYDNELAAFRAFAQTFPDRSVLLVDTYDPIQSGIPNALQVAKELRETGFSLQGIRLDSGDLGELSIRARGLLDQAGFPGIPVIASSDLDEYTIIRLRKTNARIDGWGVGTRLVTAHDQPSLGMVYKLVAKQSDSTGSVTSDNEMTNQGWVATMKFAATSDKRTIPGKKALYRLYDPSNDQAIADLICLAHETPILGDNTAQ
ncbi:hypothetical protein IWQ61_004351, partial [Dispira simplex]